MQPLSGTKQERLSPGGDADQDSDDGNPMHSGDENDHDHDDDPDAVRPGKRKRPISVSCELCKQRKVKCDRGQPSCGWCSRNGALCEYKERKKPGLRAGYGKELEQRLDRLEEVQRRHSQIIEAYMSATGGGATQSNAPASLRTSNPSNPSDQGTPHEGTMFRHSEPIRTPQADSTVFLHKPSSFPTTSQALDFNSLPQQPVQVSALHEGFQGHPQAAAAAAAAVAVAAAAASQAQPAAILPSSSSQEYYRGPAAGASIQSPGLPLQQSQGDALSQGDLPAYDLLYTLVDLFFKQIHTWCPILHRKTTMDSLFGSGPLEEADRILLHAIVATTLRYSTDPRLNEEKRKHYHDLSKHKVLLFGMDNLSVRSLQALVILALDLCGSSNGPPGWNIMALITRAVVQLGLAVESTSLSVSPNYQSIYTLRAMVLSEPKDFIEEESRRRLFWMVYLLDRYATISTAFDFALDDRDIDRTLPCRDDVWAKNHRVETPWFKTGDHDAGSAETAAMGRWENMGAFAYYINVLAILSKIHAFLKQPVDITAKADVDIWKARYKELDDMLGRWEAALPVEYGNINNLYQPGNKPVNCSWVMLQATYHTAVIRLHSSAGYPPTKSPMFTSSFHAIQRCQQAVERIARLSEFVISNSLLNKLGPPFAFTLWVAARLLLVHGSTVENILSPQITFFVNTLREMGQYWQVASRYSELLQRVLDEHRDAERQGDGMPSSVKILANMRHTAYDLDWLLSRAPKQHAHAHAHAPTRLPSVTPARTPAPNELEYLDVFSFFNYPRLMGGDHLMPFSQGIPTSGMDTGLGPNSGNGGNGGNGGVPAEYLNIGGNFSVDANSDWLFKPDDGPKYMS